MTITCPLHRVPDGATVTTVASECVDLSAFAPAVFASFAAEMDATAFGGSQVEAYPDGTFDIRMAPRVRPAVVEARL